MAELKDSSGTSFKFEHGRRFQNESQVSYVLPNDFNELDRLSQQHLMFRYILQCNFHSPVIEQLKKGITVLDSGCGPGSWTLEMAKTYPNSTFHGVDASKVFPAEKPENAQFTVSNIANKIEYPDNTFDYVYQRLLFLGLTTDDWNKAVSELYRVAKPEGYVEFIEPDMINIVNIGPLFQRLLNLVNEMMTARGLCPEIGYQLDSILKRVGFTNRAVVLYEFNMNHTNKAGTLFWEDFKQGYTGLRPVLALMNPEWEDPQVYADYLEKVGLEAQSYKTCVKFYVQYAQKPLK